MNNGYIKNNKTGQILRNIKRKYRTPLIFKSKNDIYKNNNQTSSIEFYNNKLLRNYGYQSQENSLEYSSVGINKKEDNISFWADEPGHIEWKNTDTYPVSVLNVYPEQERLTDLLITNKTGIKLRSDIYGNEFYFIKPVYSKRHAGTSYITAATTTLECVTAAEYYDGLFFDPLLRAISATEYKASGTLYSSITGMYDEFIVSNNTLCDGGAADSFFAPLSTVSCSAIHTQALSCGSVSAVSAIDCGSFIGHPGSSSDLLTTYFTDTTVPYFTIDTSTIYSNTTTTYEAAATNNPSVSTFPLFDQNFVTFGEVFVRSVYDQKVRTLQEAMSGVFNKHFPAVRARIFTENRIQDFDIIENVIYIQTDVDTLTEVYNCEDGIFKNNASSKAYEQVIQL